MRASPLWTRFAFRKRLLLWRVENGFFLGEVVVDVATFFSLNVLASDSLGKRLVLVHFLLFALHQGIG